MGCCESFGKLVMFFMNVAFSLLGAALIGVGVVLHLKLQEALEESPLLVKICPYIAIALGSIMILVAFCGCWGALTEDSGMLCCYSLFILLLVILNLSAGVLIFVKKDYIGEKVVEVLANIYELNSETFFVIGKNFNCCTEDTACDVKKCAVKIVDDVMTFSWAIALIMCVTAGAQILALVIAICLRSNVELKRHLTHSHHERYYSSCW